MADDVKADNCTKYSGKTCKDCVEVSGCSYCEPTKLCEAGSLVTKTLQKSCEGQEWMTEQCL
ncbi:negative regulation of DNA damage response, signal transduction by p53 class mediator, partial [Desmophyllum pertusum]